jgi:hypothetical protein
MVFKLEKAYFENKSSGFLIPCGTLARKATFLTLVSGKTVS